MTKLNFRKIKWFALGQIANDSGWAAFRLRSFNSISSTSATSWQLVQTSTGPGRDYYDCLKTCRSEFLISVEIITEGYCFFKFLFHVGV